MVIFSGKVFACTCSYTLLDTNAVRAAKEIFVFRIISEEIKLEDGSEFKESEVLGKIKVIDWIHGQKKDFKEIQFSTHRCCGSRFDVGNYFVAFVSNNGPKFFAHGGNVLEVGTIYDSSEIRKNITKIRSGGKELEEFFSRADRDRIEQSPVPMPCSCNAKKGIRTDKKVGLTH